MDKYINKEETIERINRLFTKNHDGSVAKNDYNSGLYAAKAEIVFITAADVQPVKRGRWICNEELYYNGMTKCSCCNEEYYTEDIQNLQGDLRTVNYCPNCGADMRGEGNDT